MSLHNADAMAGEENSVPPSPTLSENLVEDLEDQLDMHGVGEDGLTRASKPAALRYPDIGLTSTSQGQRNPLEWDTRGNPMSWDTRGNPNDLDFVQDPGLSASQPASHSYGPVRS